MHEVKVEAMSQQLKRLNVAVEAAYLHLWRAKELEQQAVELLREAEVLCRRNKPFARPLAADMDDRDDVRTTSWRG